MIVRPPQYKYQVDILKILQERPDFQETKRGFDKQLGKEVERAIWPGGEKSIVYDLCGHYIPQHIQIDWDNINMDEYVTRITKTYEKHKTMVMLSLISCCINDLKMGYKTKVEEGKIVFLN